MKTRFFPLLSAFPSSPVSIESEAKNEEADDVILSVRRLSKLYGINKAAARKMLANG